MNPLNRKNTKKDKCAFLQGQFIAAAHGQEQFPTMRTTSGEPMPEIAIVGRSNVGKSSLINSLLRNQKLAKTSSTPGKTQSIVFFSIDDQWSFVDLPGYGYAKVSLELKKKWSELIEAYLNSRKALHLILFLIDCRRDPTEQDIAFMRWATSRSIPLLLVFTKADKMTQRERESHIKNCLNNFRGFFHEDPESMRFVHYSVKDASARIELIKQINTLMT